MESYFIFLDMKIKYIQSNASFTKEKLKRKKYGINRAVKLKQKHSWRTLMTKSESYNVACNSWSRTRNKRSLRSRKNNLDGFKKNSEISINHKGNLLDQSLSSKKNTDYLYLFVHLQIKPTPLNEFNKNYKATPHKRLFPL